MEPSSMDLGASMTNLLGQPTSHYHILEQLGEGV